MEQQSFGSIASTIVEKFLCLQFVQSALYLFYCSIFFLLFFESCFSEFTEGFYVTGFSRHILCSSHANLYWHSCRILFLTFSKCAVPALCLQKRGCCVNDWSLAWLRIVWWLYSEREDYGESACWEKSCCCFSRF